MIDKVPIWYKIALTPEEAAEYSHIGINEIKKQLKNPGCIFALTVGENGGKTLIKRKEFEEYIGSRRNF